MIGGSFGRFVVPAAVDRVPRSPVVRVVGRAGRCAAAYRRMGRMADAPLRSAANLPGAMTPRRISAVLIWLAGIVVLAAAARTAVLYLFSTSSRQISTGQSYHCTSRP